jgi:hypothetical protein
MKHEKNKIPTWYRDMIWQGAASVSDFLPLIEEKTKRFIDIYNTQIETCNDMLDRVNDWIHEHAGSDVDNQLIHWESAFKSTVAEFRKWLFDHLNSVKVRHEIELENERLKFQPFN